MTLVNLKLNVTASKRYYWYRYMLARQQSPLCRVVFVLLYRVVLSDRSWPDS